MNETDRSILRELLSHCKEIEKRIERFEVDEEKFVEDTALFDMLLMPLFQIGELSGALSEEYRESNRVIPWHAIRGFRNIIGHDYGIVDPLWAWNTIKCDIPNLQAFLEHELD